jgi:hypothetical protein
MPGCILGVRQMSVTATTWWHRQQPAYLPPATISHASHCGGEHPKESIRLWLWFSRPRDPHEIIGTRRLQSRKMSYLAIPWIAKFIRKAIERYCRTAWLGGVDIVHVSPTPFIVSSWRRDIIVRCDTVGDHRLVTATIGFESGGS